MICLAAVTVGWSLHAESIIQETFEYGPDVPEREQIKEGDSLKQSGITAAGNAWQSPGIGGVAFASGKGLTIKGKETNVSIFVEVDPELFTKGSPVRAELDVVPGDLWLSSSGVPGIWLGFANADSTKNELLANINETADHLALRYAITPDPVNCFVTVETGVSGETKVNIDAKKKIPFQPESTYRMTLVFNPADRSYEATILDLKSGETKTAAGNFALSPVFNILRVDFTGINTALTTTQSMIKSISLTKE